MPSLIYTHQYDTDYNPAMPMLEIMLGRPRSEPFLPLTALVDSGADATLIPIRYLQEVQARPGRSTRMRGVTSGYAPIELYVVSLRINSYERARLEVVADLHHNEAIIGRDILNQFIVTLNGLASVVEITQ